MAKQNESLDVSANTVDEAIEQGLTQLGLSRNQVDIEIVKEGKRGVFGIGAEKALVRLTPRKERKPAERPAPRPAERPAAPAQVQRPAPTPVERPAPVPAAPPPAGVQVVETKEAPAASRPAGDKDRVGALAARYLSGLLERMGIDATVTYRIATDLVEPDEEPPLVLDVTGNDLGILIGRRSETLQALQFMVRLMVNKELNTWESIVVDVESYRVRRRRSLRQMAERMAERVVASNKKVVLEAMPPHERRIIHIALKDHPLVTTKSIGSEDNRKVTIIPR